MTVIQFNIFEKKSKGYRLKIFKLTMKTMESKCNST